MKDEKSYDIIWSLMSVIFIVIVIFGYDFLKRNRRTHIGIINYIQNLFEFNYNLDGLVIWSLLFIALFWMMFWGFKHDHYIRKRYPEMHKQFEYKGSIRLLGMKSIWENIKNSHPQDKRYTFYIYMNRIGLALLILFFIVLIFLRR